MAHIPIEEQFKQILSSKGLMGLKLGKSETLEGVLKSEAKKLHGFIQDEINSFYRSPEGWYERTEDFRNSLIDVGALTINPLTNTIEITFLPEFAWHDSWITKKHDPSYDHKGFVPLLLNEGFKILFSGGKRYPPTHFIEKAVEKYNTVKRKGIVVEIIKPKQLD